jgi:hypothetical protein
MRHTPGLHIAQQVLGDTKSSEIVGACIQQLLLFVLLLLLAAAKGLARGAPVVSGMIGLAELRLEAGDAAGALAAAKQGLKFVFDRSKVCTPTPVSLACVPAAIISVFVICAPARQAQQQQQISHRSYADYTKHSLVAQAQLVTTSAQPFLHTPQIQERARHAALVLNLLAGQALLGTGQLTDAGRIFVRLAQRVSEGEVSFGSEAVGMPATSIRQQAIR